MERKIFALIYVDEEIAFREKDDGPVAYLESEIEWLVQKGIQMSDCFIADDDESDNWKAYINYLADWAFEHQYDENEGASPLSYFEWKEVLHR